MGDRRLAGAIGVNVLLTVAQVVGGIISGSLSLVADAVHNLSDAASLGIALFARKIGRKPPDEFRTFGYRRAEVIAALINLTTLVVIGLFLAYEAVWRFIEPVAIQGWPVVIIAGVALLVDVGTALLTYTMSRHSVNVRAAFIHNLSDAMASVGVIVAGTLILLYGWVWTDALLTLLISAYILWQGARMLPETIHLLMQGTPPGVSIDAVIRDMEQVEGVHDVHHVHIWQLDEHHNSLEAHVVVHTNDLRKNEAIKNRLKTLLAEQFAIEHTTLEFEHPDETGDHRHPHH
jgi:cobalt-zinc-cadmium efflux system protein